MRLTYLRNVTKYENEGHFIIYLNETYTHSFLKEDNAWTETVANVLIASLLKGQAISLHANEKKFFVLNAFLIFKVGSETGDYQGDIMLTSVIVRSV
jgi:hypothetical protein